MVIAETFNFQYSYRCSEGIGINGHRERSFAQVHTTVLNYFGRFELGITRFNGCHLVVGSPLRAIWSSLIKALTIFFIGEKLTPVAAFTMVIIFLWLIREPRLLSTPPFVRNITDWLKGTVYSTLLMNPWTNFSREGFLFFCLTHTEFGSKSSRLLGGSFNKPRNIWDLFESPPKKVGFDFGTTFRSSFQLISLCQRGNWFQGSLRRFVAVPAAGQSRSLGSCGLLLFKVGIFSLLLDFVHHIYPSGWKRGSLPGQYKTTRSEFDVDGQISECHCPNSCFIQGMMIASQIEKR